VLGADRNGAKIAIANSKKMMIIPSAVAGLLIKDRSTSSHRRKRT
jgi:hypothetical protein